VSAVSSPGESSALAEYLSGREELASLIANVEARMPSASGPAVQSEPAPVIVPRAAAKAQPELQVAPEPESVPLTEVVATEAVAEANAGPDAEPSEFSATPDAKLLTEAVEQVTRASELIAQSCALFIEALDADRAERRALADAVKTLAQALVPAPSTPRLVGGSVFAGPARTRDHDVVIDDDRNDASVSAPAVASSPADQSTSGAPRPAVSTPRPSNWSAAQTTSTPPTSKPPRGPGNRSGG
jgi:hypothetical protein